MEELMSLKCTLNGTPRATRRALREAESFAGVCGLSEKQTLHLRLLTEELLGLVNGLTDTREGFFWLERENGVCRLCLTARTETIGEAAKERLLDTSKSGENTFYQGVSGKIRLVLDFFSDSPAASVSCPGEVEAGMLLQYSQQGAMWSLEQYRRGAEREKRAMEWDMLERSILTRLADDVQVGLNNSNLTITILKRF